MKISLRVVAAFGLAIMASPVLLAAEIVHQAPAEFLAEQVPDCRQQALWLDRDLKEQAAALLERPYAGARVRYCERDGRTAWILDEIGKTEPITTGIVIDEGRVQQVRVLVFRESRGGEVHREAFTRQFAQATLDDAHRLDRTIDGITGATLSVWALNRQVRLALLFDGAVRAKRDDA
ncbi:MAG: FMN-binding protein [Xanthomonadales bacterium]